MSDKLPFNLLKPCEKWKKQRRAERISRSKDVASCFNKREQFVSVWWTSGLPHTQIKWSNTGCSSSMIIFFEAGVRKRLSLPYVMKVFVKVVSVMTRFGGIVEDSIFLCTRKNLSRPQVLHFRQNYTFPICLRSSQKAASSSCSCTVSQPRSACRLIAVAMYSLRIISWSSGGRFWIKSTTAVQTI